MHRFNVPHRSCLQPLSGVPSARLWSCCGGSHSSAGRVVGGHQHRLRISDCKINHQNSSVHHLEAQGILISQTANLCVPSVISLSTTVCMLFPYSELGDLACSGDQLGLHRGWQDASRKRTGEYSRFQAAQRSLPTKTRFSVLIFCQIALRRCDTASY